MTLSALIRKRDTGNRATAIPAISATQPKGEAATVARIATVAVANPAEPKTAKPAEVGAGDTARTPADDRMEHEADKLRGNPGLIYAMTAHDDIEPDAVILTLAIRDKAACELRIPKSRYDAFALLELIEKHTTRETLQ